MTADDPLPHGHVLVDGELDIAALRRAVVIFYPRWSPYARLCLRRLGELPAPTTDPWLYIVDTDRTTPEWMREELELGEGWGETFWIRDGVIVHRDRAYQARAHDLIAPTTALFD